MANTKKDGSSYSEPSYVTDSSSNVTNPFYRPDISQLLVPATRNLLENYSHIPANEQAKHVHEIRDKAWSIRPYPCIGVGAYLVPQLSRLPVYPEILKRLSGGQQLLEVGCFLGGDMRNLANAGVPSENLHGIDIVNFWDLGFEMFKDQGRFNAKFTQADMMADDGSLADFERKFDVVSVFQVLHQWNWAGQVAACKALVKFCRPDALIVGNQMGNITPQDITLPSLPLPLWRHDQTSFARLWDEVGIATGTKWECETWMRTFEGMEWKKEDEGLMEVGVRVMEFVVRRVE